MQFFIINFLRERNGRKYYKIKLKIELREKERENF